MSIQPQGEDLRKAVKWISEERKFTENVNVNKLVQEACSKFNLSPKEEEYLIRFVKEETPDA